VGPPQTNDQLVIRPVGLQQVAISTIVPLLVAIFAFPGTLIIGERYGSDTMPVALIGLLVALVASAVWLNRLLYRRASTVFPSLVAVATVLLVWVWQRQAFIALVPYKPLTYGYFLLPEGARAQFWVLVCPFWVGVVCLALCFIAGLVTGWLIGARRSLLCIIPWWITAFLVFALPSLDLWAQGNAAIFI